MSILNYLPTFKVVEINRSTGLVKGHILSQNLGGAALTLNTTAVSGYSFAENGLIVGLSFDRTIENFDPEKHSQPFLVFTEELNTVLNGLKYFATEVEDDVVYPRAVGLYIGDTFTTDYYSGVCGPTTLYAKVVNGVLTLQTVADAYTLFAVSAATLPDGTTAAKFTYIDNALMGTGVIDTITFDLNGGSYDGSTDDVVEEVYDGVTFAASELSPDPTRVGYQFNGWYVDEAGTELVNPALVIHEDLTVYAGWLQLFDLTFMLNGANIGGEVADVVATDVPEGDLILDYAPATPTMVYADHVFDNWYFEDPENPGEPDLILGPVSVVAPVTPVGVMTIVANWLQLFNVTFNGNGGTIDGDATAVALDVVENTLVGVAFGDIPTPVRSGYTYVSPYWWTTAGGPEDAASSPVVADVEVFAAWELITYDIAYVLDGGDNDVDNPETYTILTPKITLKAATKGGYTFDGWFSDSGFVNPVTEINLGSTGNVTLYAKFVIIDYTITYELDGGVNHVSNPETYTITTPEIALAVATKDGYTFNGWFQDAIFTEPATTVIPLGSTGDLTLYAKFVIIDYTITYELDGGVNDVDNPATYTIATPTITLEEATKDGYTFNGWYSNAGLTTEVTSIPLGSTENITLYAKFTIN